MPEGHTIKKYPEAAKPHAQDPHWNIERKEWVCRHGFRVTNICISCIWEHGYNAGVKHVKKPQQVS